MKRLAKHSEKGFTLVELLVVMIVMSILALSLANFIATWLQQEELAQARANLLLNAESALDTVTGDIRISGDADDTNRWADTYGPGGQFGWQSGSQILVLATVATDSSNNIIYTDSAKYISQKDNQIYYLSGTTLLRRTLASDSAGDAAVTTCPAANATSTCPADKTIATGVTSLTFSYYDANENAVSPPTNARSIQISITLTTTLNGKSISATYSANMVCRNE